MREMRLMRAVSPRAVEASIQPIKQAQIDCHHARPSLPVCRLIFAVLIPGAMLLGGLA